MKCRKCIRVNDDHYNVVQYGSYGLENPYGIVFKISDGENKRELTEEEINGTGIKGYVQGNIESLNFTVDLLNKTISCSSEMKITIFYYNKKMYNEDFKKSDNTISLEYLLEPGINNFEFLMMAKKWKDDLSSYAEKQEGTASSLIQRLSVIQGELWYKINYGLPLFDKVRDKGIMDSVIIDMILSHPDVASIEFFASSTSKEGVYTFDGAKIITVFNESIELTKVMG